MACKTSGVESVPKPDKYLRTARRILAQAWPTVGLAGCALVGFSVGIFWPGTFSLAAANCRTGGTALFALLALAGDLGCSSGPATVGLAANAAGGDLRIGLFAAIGFPALLLVGLWLHKRQKQPV